MSKVRGEKCEVRAEQRIAPSRNTRDATRPETFASRIFFSFIFTRTPFFISSAHLIIFLKMKKT
jgi:hypothetical protein